MAGMDLAGLHPELRPYADYALAIAKVNGLAPTVTSVARSWATQTKLRDNFEWCLENACVGVDCGFVDGHDCRYPANAPGDSAHGVWAVDGSQGSLAFDSVVDDDQWELWTAIRRWVGFTVPDNDRVHAELPSWRSYVGSTVASR